MSAWTRSTFVASTVSAASGPLARLPAAPAADAVTAGANTDAACTSMRAPSALRVALSFGRSSTASSLPGADTSSEPSSSETRVSPSCAATLNTVPFTTETR